MSSVLSAVTEIPETEGEQGGTRVVIRGVEKSYVGKRKSVTALAKVNLEISPGEIVALLGPSGCGKSTLLKLVAGLYPVSSGTISIGDRVVQGPHPGVGMMFQTPVLLPWLSTLSNVMLPHRIAKKEGNAARDKAMRLLEMVGLTEFEKALPAELSGGMQQRVAICRALMTDPALLLMDEPFGALDELIRERMDLEVRALIRREGMTAVFVTHSLPEAVYVADRVVVMCSRPGRILGEIRVNLPGDRASEVLDSPIAMAHVHEARKLLEESQHD